MSLSFPVLPGLFHQSVQNMCNAMRALKRSGDTLLAIAEAFVYDPLVEWTKGAAYDKRQIGDDEDGEDESSASAEQKTASRRRNGGRNGQLHLRFDPAGRVRILKRKLQGEHPSAIMRTELDANTLSTVQKVVHHYKRLVDGGRGSVRAGLRAGVLSVEDQVDCLIDLATDPNVLARQWVGLTTWL